MNEEKFISKRGKMALSAVASLSFVGSFYAFGIEPYCMKVLEVPIHTRLNGECGTLRVAQFTDVHLSRHFGLFALRKLVSSIMKQKPDVIFFTGDLINRPKKYHAYPQVATILAKLQAPYGKFAVLGNHDHYGGLEWKVKKTLRQAGFILLENKQAEFETKQGMKVKVLGLADALYGNPEYSLIQEKRKNQIQIVLLHEGDFAKESAKRGADLILSGHSHGGQIRFPVLGAPVTARYARKYIRGVYKIKKSILYVDSGVGTTGIPARFGVPAQFSILSIH